MSNNTKIFSEAIAEAKAIRETAMANAKLALEEAFAPRIQEMMSDKLEALAEEEEMEEGYKKELDEELEESSKENMEEISLEELLSELESLEEEHAEPDADNFGGESDNDADNQMEENTIFEAEDEDEVGEITVDELKDIIRDIMADVMGGESEEDVEGEEEGEGEEGEEGEEEMSAEDDLELEEILAEIEALGEEKSSDDESSMKYEAKEKELEEAMNTIATLRSELNEVNLLNAKLLYVNKLFKAKNLNESQKVKVINAFDRAETVREAKNVYDTLSESLTTEKAKSQIKESLSFASKPAGMAPNRQPIVENDDFVKRMQKIAGII